jgi:hypothetical protein
MVDSDTLACVGRSKRELILRGQRKNPHMANLCSLEAREILRITLPAGLYGWVHYAQAGKGPC